MTNGSGEDGGEWMTANDALLKLMAKGMDPATAKSMLAEYLRDGLLSARVDAAWISTESNLNKAWKSEENGERVEQSIIVPVKYWRSDRRALDDRARWRWPFNKFFYTIATNPIKRRMLRGVSFSVQELVKLQPDLFPGEIKPKRGRNPDVSARDAGWMEIVRLSQEGQLNSDTFKTVTGLKDELQARLKLTPNGPSRLGEQQIKEIASMVIKVLKPGPPT